MSKKAWVVELVTQIVKDRQTAEIVVERLMEEGLLSLGYGDKDVDTVVMKFTDTFGTTKVSKYDRFAARRLSQKYGAQAVSGIVELLGHHRGNKYAPVVGSVQQLEEKWVNVVNYIRSLKTEQPIDN